MPSASWSDRIALRVAAWHAGRVLRQFLDAARRARDTQKGILAAKVRLNADCDFGRAHGLATVRDAADLAQRLPVMRYEDYAPFIERLKRGEPQALLGGNQRVLMFALTSGAASEPKHVPVTPTFLAEYRRGWNVWGLRALADHPGAMLRAIVQVSSPMNDSRTEAGIPCGAITGLLAATQKRLVRKYYTAPADVAAIPDAAARYYAVMRFAVTRDVAFLITANPATLLQLALVGRERPAELVRDVRDGAIGREFDVPTAIRGRLEARLRPDPEAASRLEALASRHGALRPRDLWRLSFVAHWLGGSMGLYRGRFVEPFGEVPVRDPGLLASEGRMSVPIDDDSPAGILDVTSHYYEFVPADAYEAGDRRTIGLTDLRIGEDYFLVLTTSSGFWRYDIGDRVRMVGWFGEAPVIEFLSKGAHTSSMAGEKLTEDQVVSAARAAGLAARPFVVAAVWGDPPFYRLWIEDDDAIAGRLASALDEALRKTNIEYSSRRDSRRLGPVAFRSLAAGTLAAFDRRMRARQLGRAEQYKRRILSPEPEFAEHLGRIQNEVDPTLSRPETGTDSLPERASQG